MDVLGTGAPDTQLSQFCSLNRDVAILKILRAHLFCVLFDVAKVDMY